MVRGKLSSVVFSLITLSFIFGPALLNAQELEEIVVTAERRVQSLQEVPISVDVYTGADIDLQGFRSLDDLSKFSTSIQISNGIQEQNVAIRSFSTRGNSLTLQSAAPLFLDGVHFGRMSMVKTAFLDTERVEVLKGPQPLHFGMNATAGAFNIQSARPTDVWEGNLAGEFGSDGKKELNGAISGPINDTLAFRLAGIFEGSDGPVFNRYNPDERLPRFHHLGGRAALQWTPRDDLTIFSKIERSRQRNGSELTMGCLTGSSRPLSGYGDSITDSEFDPALVGLFGDEQSVFADPPTGIGGIAGIINPEVRDPEDCFKGDYAFGRGGPYAVPPGNVNSSQASRRPTDGSVDSRALHQLFYSQDGPESVPGVGGANHGGEQGATGKDWIDTWNGLLDINFELANGINLNSQSGWAKLDRLASRDFVLSPFLLGYQPKMEDYNQFSQLLRVDSPAEGYDVGAGLNVEFFVQGFYQEAGLNFWNGNSEGGGIRRPMRFNNGWETSKWYAGSWGLTFNVFEDQLSLSVGGRYTDIKKNVRIGGWGAQFIFDEIPCDSAGTDSDPATCAIDPHFVQVDTTLTDVTWADPSRDIDERVRIDNPQLLLPGVDVTNLWTPTRWGSRAITGVPLNYRNGGVPAVGFTAPNFKNNIPAPWNEIQKADDYNTQVVLSFTPNNLDREHTFYGKYAEAFKGPVTDTGQGGLPLTFQELAFEPEFVKAWEVGAKGTLMNRRMRYDIDVFRNTFTDLQTIGAAPLFNPQDQTSVSLNAGKQRVDGLEFNFQYAATENLVLDVSGTFLDGKFLEFEGDGCSESENIAAALNALANPGGFSDEEVDAAQEIIDDLDPTIQALLPAASEIPEEYFISGGCLLVNTPEFDAGTTSVGEAGTISRTGVTPPDTPDWRFVLGGTYTQPVTDRLEAFLNVKWYIADSFRSGRSNNPTVSTFYDSGFDNMDMNISGGIGSQDGTWRIVGYARNIFENTEHFHPEFALIPSGFVTNTMSENSFMSYGIRLEYRYQ